MKKIILSACCFITASLAIAQSPTFELAKQIGGFVGEASGKFITTDISGNVYTAGYFNGRVDFDPGAGVYDLASTGGNDIFISKSDASGNLIWAKKMGGTSNDIVNAVFADASGNVYTTGNFQGIADFDPNSGTFNLTTVGSEDIFISKLDASGNFVWAKSIGGTSFDQGFSVTVDGSGNVYTTGYFQGTADFDPGAGIFNLTSNSTIDIFISKLDASGNFVWAIKISGQNSTCQGLSIAIDGSGYVYTTGSFSGTADFDPGPGISNLSGTLKDIFILKLNSSGNFIWAKSIGGSSNDLGASIKVDGSGYLYTTGYFTNIVDFDPGPGFFYLSTAFTVDEDIFISKLDTAGNFVWAKKLGGGSSPDHGSAIAIDGLQNVYTAGTFQQTGDFDPGVGTFNLVSAGLADIFISKLDASGNFVWAKQWGGIYNDYGNSIALDVSGNVYSTGNFSGTVDFDPGPGIFNFFASTYLNSYISKLNSSGNFDWAEKSGANAASRGNAIALDDLGNIYTTGGFSGTNDFDPGAGTQDITSNGLSDIFITKTDVSGNLLWVRHTGGALNDQGLSIEIDGSGNIYTTGSFYGTVDFNPDAGVFNLTSVGNNDIFLLKLNNSGNFVWAKNIGGTSVDEGYSLDIDAADNIYTTGYFSGTADFDPGAGIFNLTSAGSRDIFILKLDASGNFAWAKQMGGTSSDIGQSIIADAGGNSYITGIFQATGDFDPGAGIFNLTSAGVSDIFVSKLDASGNYVWAKQMGGTGDDYGYDIVLDASGNVFTTGSFGTTADFDPGTGIFNLTTAGNNDIFISKLDASGNFLWAGKAGGPAYDEAFSITSDLSGNVYITGDFQVTSDFDPGAGTFNLTSAGSMDCFLLKLNNSGNFQWVSGIGGTSSQSGNSIVTDITGNIYTVGYFYGATDFDPGAGTFNLTAIGTVDFFLHKMSQCASPSASITPAGSTTFCSGNSVLLNANTGTGFSYQWKKNGADISGATNQNYTATAAGSYSVVITNACGTATSSSVTVTVNSLPSATITPAGSTTFCSGGSVVLSVPFGANKTYQWKKGANLISGATSSSYTATTGGNYKVIVTNTVTGCSKTTNSATVVTVNALPAATITPQGPTTFCAGGSVVLQANTGTGLTYKWKKGTSFISGATLSNYTATTGGNYRVQVTNSNGCSKTSALVAVSVPCKEGESISIENNFDFTVYPNPNAGEFTIKFSNKPSSPLSIELTDELGKVVRRFEANHETVVIKESSLAKGIYCLTARNKDEVVIRKISVVK